MTTFDASLGELNGESQFPKLPMEASQSEQTRLQMLWDEHTQVTTPYVRYSRTVVLLISWDDQVDDLKTKQEVNDLAAVFKDSYCFNTTIKHLTHEYKPQHLMNAYLANFLLDHDAPHTLIIIYYAGHGFADISSDSTFKLNGNTSSVMQNTQLERNTVVWEDAEHMIQGTDSDILVIFDCCQAGVLARHRSKSRFQILGACAADKTTKPPGRESFTSALIWALRNLCQKDFFPLTELQQQIFLAPDFPKDQYPTLIDRSQPGPDYILISPMRGDMNGQAKASPAHIRDDLSGEYLNLRFHFANKVKDDELSRYAREINQLLLDKKVKAERVSFLGKHSYHQKTAEYARRWREVVNRKSATVSKKGPSLRVNTTANRPQGLLIVNPSGSEAMVLPEADGDSTPRNRRRRQPHRRTANRPLRSDPSR